ncbi:MAG: hypothetical protein A2X19_06825 [Bacteroidetes bacterium GWE2_39_28]|nr:MAG: hypothetical protein A2X19_06825 [Bacteroidetes bacterium GWE2_39_28]OFY13069.1 MAG: hypothetical protein A2X16_00465 [Bacteroidetes bacterium GWF2_39_10]OFZ09135.1 MAG: hypothetical protein A2322_06290 [Bacteroidetes bacterium RIFOXYB2_FULL_39_7]OFZ12129.1 MAG: hypothetical protein A2465_08875 [Bacteroidetes bacterium RIFOXYC2_FULL_39_11]HCT94564.1 hypothetical protein [Rikenellaceae bacterium]
MKYRLAKLVDCKAIVELHFAIRETYSVGIFARLGKLFMNQYYRIILNDPNSIIVCAEDESGFLLGFCSSTLDVEAQMANIKKHQFKLVLAAIISVIGNPSLLKHLIDRYRVISNNSKSTIINTKGARSEYWVWNASRQDSVSSVEMYFAQLNILKSLGVKEIFGEVDVINSKILKFHLANGAEINKSLKLPDGRERIIIRVDLENWNYKEI